MVEDRDELFDELEAEAEATPETPTEKSLETVRAMGVEAAEIESRIRRGEELLSKLKSRRWELLNKEMPAMMDDLRVPYVAVDSFHLEVVDYYKASIAADDPEEKRDAAFAWLEQAGGGDIVNNVVSVYFPREDADMARELQEELSSRFHNHQGIQISRERKVPWNRLTSWLKDYVRTPPKRGETKLAVPLELLNATLGRIVKIKDVKSDD